MRRRLIHIAIIVAFGAALGRYALHIFAPIAVTDHVVRGQLAALRGTDPRAKNLYLRRSLYLPQRPRSAWMQVLGIDYLELYVNGRQVELQENDGYPVAIVTELTPLLQAGHNVLAVVCRQASLDRPPVVSVEGAYLLDGVEHAFGVDDQWRHSDRFERTDAYWFDVAFDDHHWPMAPVGQADLRAPLPVAREALVGPATGRWITPGDSGTRTFTVRRDFALPERVEHAWLRLQCTGPFRLAVNGALLDVHEEQLGTTVPPPPSQWIYDLSALLRKGPNAVTLAINSTGPPAHIQADMVAQARSGYAFAFPSDKAWQWRSGIAADWLAREAGAGAWQPCLVVSGDVIPPWQSQRWLVRTSAPLPILLRLAGRDVLAVLLATLGTWAATWIVDRSLLGWRTGAGRLGISPAVLTLVPMAVLLWGAALVVYDPHVRPHQVYRPLFLLLVGGLLAGQWIALAVLRRRRTAGAAPSQHTLGPHLSPTPKQGLTWAVVLLLATAGAYLRIRDITARPLSPDEVSMHRATLGFLERGFPSIEIHPDIPVVYAATSELVYCGSALVGLFVEDERLVVRTPAVIWGTLTIFLMFWCGGWLFRPSVGWIAAGLYAFSPFCVGMANLGRYYSQLQALALLTVCFFCRTITPPDRLDRRALWLTVVCFCAMFLSWEGSALIAPALMMAAVIHRRHRLHTILREPAVWQGLLVVAAVVLVQGAHRSLVQVARPLFGSGASDVEMTPMWRYPGFDLWYYLRSATWNRDMLLPWLGLGGGVALAIRHAYRSPARALLVIFVAASVFQAMVLPVTGKRYSYHLLPMWMLLASATVSAVGRGLSRAAPLAGRNSPRTYARMVGRSIAAAYVVLGCGWFVDLSELGFWRASGTELEALKQPGQQPSTRYVVEHLEPDDVVIANGPHVIDHYLGRPSDYWLQTEMRLQATMDDRQPIPLHRLQGTVMLRDLDHVKDVFSRHQRIWFVAEPAFNARTNTEATNRFLRGNMDVVYEDYSSLVMFRGDRHRPASLQRKNEASLAGSGTSFLP